MLLLFFAVLRKPLCAAEGVEANGLTANHGLRYIFVFILSAGGIPETVRVSHCNRPAGT